MAKLFFIETFGCQMNDLDSEKIAGSFLHGGMERTDNASQADVIILNTCSVRDKAVQKVYARLGEIRRYKDTRKDLIVGVVGCMAQLEGENILKRAPYVSILAGPQKGHVIGDLVERSNGSHTAVVDLRKDTEPSPLETFHILRENPWQANVTISEGCNRRCTYCVVPITRGNERVRDSASIIREVEELCAKGYIEVMLLGQTVNSYKDRVSHINFAQLLRRISAVSGLKRIRFTSPHPSDFTDELLDVMVSYPQVCNQIHLPVQSGATRMLTKMGRGYTRERYMEIIRKLHNAPRSISISTDIIVGFPGESDSDFQDTLSLLDEVQYESVFSFKYSPRPFTKALNFADEEIPEEEKGRRLKIVQEKQKHIQYALNASYLGKRIEVLVEGRAKSRVRLAGRTSNNKIVNFDGPDKLIGQFAQIEISGYSANSLKGIWIQS
jgi:tRNA-2-methylthio-N6-dimethylallyladenosine synthase